MMKRLISLVLALLIALSIIPLTANPVSASTIKTKEQAMTWLQGKVGEKVGSGQCVALTKAYYIALGVDSVKGNGCDYATNDLPYGWKRIKGEKNPQKGDILVWTDGWKGYGHVAICGENAKGKKVYYHQNWDGEYVQVKTESYTSGFNVTDEDTGIKYKAKYYGVIRPDFREEKLTYASIADGKYYIKNFASGKYMNVLDGKDENKATINTREFTGNKAQTFKITKTSKGYTLMPGCSTTKVVNGYADTVVGGTKVNLYKKTGDKSQLWKFEAVDGGYVIRNAQRPGMCITASKDGTKLTTAVYRGLSRQIWCLEGNCGDNHDWEDATCTESKSCKICSQTKGDALGHDWGDWEITKQPTTSEEGEKLRQCLRKGCEYFEIYVIEKLPAAPKLKVSIDAATGKPLLKWNQDEGAAGHIIYRTSVYGADEYQVNAGESYRDDSAEAGIKYCYWVCAVNGSGAKSEKSNGISATCDLPQPKVTLSNVASTGKIKLSWEKVEGATKYEIWRSTTKNGTYTKISTVTGTSATNTKTEAGKTYYYKVKALHSNSSANSAYSAVVYRMCDLPRPDVTVKLNAKGKPVLSWDKIEGATKYEIYRATTKNGTYTKLSTITGTRVTNTKVESGKTYYYKVRAIHSNSSANSAYSAIDSIKLK